MSNQEQQQKKALPFGSIAAQTQGLTIGGRSKQQSSTAETNIASTPAPHSAKMPAFKTALDPQEERKQQTAYLPVSLRHWLRIRAPIEDRDISDIVTDALLLYRERVEGQEAQ